MLKVRCSAFDADTPPFAPFSLIFPPHPASIEYSASQEDASEAEEEAHVVFILGLLSSSLLGFSASWLLGFLAS